ncbi:MAG: hypothetical protein F6K40_27655 [Okeania sp. SIO3I5]|uniref:hypothetical protein n=1 Tax=Okeania sp. SIO3I5 TaxID=2607805 RepID=UPI0013B92F40|nr:hypothetical protein [Okeania sp. SIO3I5]NEQ39821.1 hypothetical protein [Okeania sp. SIO3I5]
MLFYLKVFISIVTIISTVQADLYLPNSIFVTINNQIIVRRRKPRRPRRQIREQIKPTETPKIKSICPKNSDNLEILVAALISDLPSYVNREIQRERQPNKDYLKRNIIIAGRPEFEHLPIDYTPFIEEGINQIFLTTLERQYRDSQVVELQRFHWLFMRQNQAQWELINMFSIEESFPANLPVQAEDSSNGVFAKGIRAWLKKCYFQEENKNQETNREVNSLAIYRKIKV